MVQYNNTTNNNNISESSSLNHLEFKIDKQTLLTSIEKTLTVVERRTTMPALNYALLELSGKLLKISATDLEIFISATCECENITNGRLAVPAKSVYEIVRECDDTNEIYFRSLENNRIEIISGKSNFKLLGLSPDSFPTFKVNTSGKESEAILNCKSFATLLNQTEYAVSTEEIRYFLTGIYLESNPDADDLSLRGVATDGSRLALYDLPQEENNSLKIPSKGLILPKKASNELRKLLESADSENFKISCDENLLKVFVDSFELFVRPVEGDFPNYKPVIPYAHDTKYWVNRKSFIKSLKKMNLLVSDRARAVSFQFKNNKIILVTNNPDLGEARDELLVKSQNSKELTTGFNVKFLLDAVNSFNSEELCLHVGEKLQPVKITSEDDSGYLAVVMPMRI